MDVSVKMDLAMRREPAQVFPQTSSSEASNAATRLTPLAWEPALDLVEEAATKIALYERSFSRLEELAERNADQAESDKCQLMERIADLSKRLQESEANYEKTLDLLQASTKICMIQRMELRAMRETLSEGSSHASLMASYIKRLTLIVSQTADSEADGPALNAAP
jgi:hypothetical protein